MNWTCSSVPFISFSPSKLHESLLSAYPKTFCFFHTIEPVKLYWQHSKTSLACWFELFPTFFPQVSFRDPWTTQSGLLQQQPHSWYQFSVSLWKTKVGEVDFESWFSGSVVHLVRESMAARALSMLIGAFGRPGIERELGLEMRLNLPLETYIIQLGWTS